MVFTKKNTFNLYKIEENIYTRETKSVNLKKEKQKTNVSIVDIETVYSISHLHEFELPEKVTITEKNPHTYSKHFTRRKGE